MKYKSFSKSKFEFELNRIRVENDLWFWKDVTEQVSEESDVEIMEYVYMFSTNNRSLKILIYSSLDLNTLRTRDYSSDAVRVVYRWETRNGVLYKKIAKHLRIENLFNNLENTIVNNIYVDSIDYNGWIKSSEFENKELC